MLSDRQILQYRREGLIEISPFSDRNLQPVSYDVHLGRPGLLAQWEDAYLPLDLGTEAPDMQEVTFPTRWEQVVFYLHPKQFVLGVLVERITLADNIAMRLDGRSKIGRAGLLIHVTAGLVEPGWNGRLTLEMYNLSTRPIRLWEGMEIGQVTFEELVVPALRTYGHPALNSHYQGSTTVHGSVGLMDTIERL